MSASTKLAVKPVPDIHVVDAPPPRKRAGARAERGNGQAMSADQRQHYIQVAAYYIAERGGFSGDPLDDWVRAEQEVDRLIGGRA